jgi:hypothetical protein
VVGFVPLVSWPLLAPLNAFIPAAEEELPRLLHLWHDRLAIAIFRAEQDSCPQIFRFSSHQAFAIR